MVEKNRAHQTLSCLQPPSLPALLRDLLKSTTWGDDSCRAVEVRTTGIIMYHSDPFCKKGHFVGTDVQAMSFFHSGCWTSMRVQTSFTVMSMSRMLPEQISMWDRVTRLAQSSSNHYSKCPSTSSTIRFWYRTPKDLARQTPLVDRHSLFPFFWICNASALYQPEICVHPGSSWVKMIYLCLAHAWQLVKKNTLQAALAHPLAVVVDDWNYLDGVRPVASLIITSRC